MAKVSFTAEIDVPSDISDPRAFIQTLLDGATLEQYDRYCKAHKNGRRTVAKKTCQLWLAAKSLSLTEIEISIK